MTLVCYTKFEKKKQCWFGKSHVESDKFPPEDTKFSKLRLSLDPFIQSRKCVSLKVKEDLCVNEE